MTNYEKENSIMAKKRSSKVISQIGHNYKVRARVEFEIKYNKSINREMRILDVDDNIYELSKNMEQYKGYRISEIDPITSSVTFTNGEVIRKGDVVGDVSEKDMRRIQIRETIISHSLCLRRKQKTVNIIIILIE